MAAATITSQSYGLKATGGTDATQVASGRVRVKSLVVTCGTAAAGSVIVATGTTGTAVAYGTFNSATASRSTAYELNADMDGIVATLSAADVVAIFNVTLA
jgi:hypothetical protein